MGVELVAEREPEREAGPEPVDPPHFVAKAPARDLTTVARVDGMPLVVVPPDTQRFKQLRIEAVREGRFALIDHELLSAGPSIGDGLVALASALHPDAFR